MFFVSAGVSCLLYTYLKDCYSIRIRLNWWFI